MTWSICASTPRSPSLIEPTNHLTKAGVSSRAAVEPLVPMLAPVAPHIAEAVGTPGS
ncbi:hypothetical protein [Aeromicrobium sp. UC242_57]|uniref:hypothetical protein n=1 Tax=Aeromicrobium sp. UC242_57 TaxID=3374624 RepID=UPI00379BA076